MKRNDFSAEKIHKRIMEINPNSFLFQRHYHATLIVGRLNIGTFIPFQKLRIGCTLVFGMLREPFVVKRLVLLLKGCHATVEVHLQPLATAERI